MLFSGGEMGFFFFFFFFFRCMSIAKVLNNWLHYPLGDHTLFFFLFFFSDLVIAYSAFWVGGLLKVPNGLGQYKPRLCLG